MALVTHQLQGSLSTSPSKPLSWDKGISLRQTRVSLQLGLANFWSLNKCSLRLGVGTQNFVAQRKLPKISAFKGNARIEESESRASSSKPSNQSIKVSYLPQTNDETPVQSSKAQNVPHSYASVAKVSVVKLPIVQKLFKRWLKILVIQTPSESAEEILEGGKVETKISEIQNLEQEKSSRLTQNVAWGYFLSLDMTITLPMIFFIPFYLAVNFTYGTKVARQLTPLWLAGPLLIALYVKLARWIITLYIFTFKVTIIFLKNTPSYMQAASAFITKGAGETKNKSNIKIGYMKSSWISQKQYGLSIVEQSDF